MLFSVRPALSALLLLFCNLSYAQPGSLTPPTELTAAEKEILSTVTRRYQQDVAGLTGSYKKYIADFYKERYEMVQELLEEKEIIPAGEAHAYLNKIAGEILKYNPSIDKNALRILFSRSFVANAYSVGEGTILFHIGLFHRLSNESQVAFILSHELAHYYLNHGNDHIKTYVTTIYSDEFQKQLKAIKKSDYGKTTQLEALAKNLNFRNRRHSRQFEQAADSMALELLKNTPYDVREALTCLALLDSADSNKYNSASALEEQFHTTGFPFKKNWLENDELRFTETKSIREKREEDSLKTHPDCSLRIERLSEKVKDYYKEGSRKFLVDTTTFYDLKVQFDYGVIEYCFQTKKMSRALYLALQMLRQHPDDSYLNIMVGQCLNEIYQSQKSHQLSKVVDVPRPDQDPKYNTVLIFLQNLRLQEVAALSYHYLKQKEPALLNHPSFQQAFSKSKQNFNIQ
ncbi:MAG: M48 family metalloprotease [Chitinophagaceae bacterium]